MDHSDLVRQVKDALNTRHIDVSGSCGAFEIVKHVAWQLRSEGAGLRRKPGGNVCSWNGQTYAVDIVSFADRVLGNPDYPDGWKPNGINVDMLGDAGGANTPAWNPYEADPNVVQFHQPALDPGFDVFGGIIDGPPAPPPPVPIDARLHNMELELSDLQKVANQSFAKLDTVATKDQVAQLETRTNTALQAAIKQVLAALPRFPFFRGTKEAMTLSPFSPEATQAAIQQALATIPDDKRGALVATVAADGTVSAVIASRFTVGPTDWVVSGQADWHGGAIDGRVSVVASW